MNRSERGPEPLELIGTYWNHSLLKGADAALAGVAVRSRSKKKKKKDSEAVMTQFNETCFCGCTLAEQSQTTSFILIVMICNTL